MTLAVHGCSLCTKPTDGLRDVFCCTSVSRHTKSLCALQCHHTNPLSCKVPKITTLTWSGDAWQGLRVILSLAAHPVHKRRLKICDDIMVGNRKGRTGRASGARLAKKNEAHRMCPETEPTCGPNALDTHSACQKRWGQLLVSFPGPNGGPETLPASSPRECHTFGGSMLSV